MNKTEIASQQDLRRRLFDMLDSLPAVDAHVVKAIPVAFPVVEATYTLRERVPEPIGLVRRAVLKAVCDFGPCDTRDVDELLGLGEDVIEQTLLALTKSVPDLVRNGNKYAAGPECVECLRAEEVRRLVEHERKFIVNGLTDQLLPVDFWRMHHGLRLYPHPGDPNGTMRTESGQPTPIKARIVDRGVTGREHLQRLADGGDTAIRCWVGVPAGVCEQIAEPLALRIAWVFCFLIVRADDSVELLSARRNPVALLDRKVASRDYMLHVCQGVEPWILESGNSTRPSEKFLDRWPQGTQIDAGRTPDELRVRILEPESMLRSISEGASKEKSSRILLEHGRDWNSFTCAIYRIVPGDLPTAKAVALLRGISELRHILRPLECSPSNRPPFDLAVWWQEWQAKFSQQFSIDLTQAPADVDQLLTAADQVNDTEFQEKLEWLQG